jgi:hypothetical protein
MVLKDKVEGGVLEVIWIEGGESLEVLWYHDKGCKTNVPLFGGAHLIYIVF